MKNLEYEADNYDDSLLQSLTNLKFQEESIKIVKIKQFDLWIRDLLYLNELLHDEYNLFYQQLFIVKLSELFGEGCKYAKCSLDWAVKNNFTGRIAWYKAILEGIEIIKSYFTDVEFAYFEYRRHNVCHIFQSAYDVIQDSGKIKKERRITNKAGNPEFVSIIELEFNFDQLLCKYGGALDADKNFDIAMHKLIYPALYSLHERLQEIHNKESKGEI